MLRKNLLATVFGILFTLHKLDFIAGEESKNDTEAPKDTYQLEPLSVLISETANSLHWCIETQNLFFADSFPGKLLRYDYKEKKIHSCIIETKKHAAFVVPVEKSADTFIVGGEHRIVSVEWPNSLSNTSCTIKSTIFRLPNRTEIVNERFKTGKCDPRGRLFAGTTRTWTENNHLHQGEFYEIQKDGKTKLIKHDVGLISRGLAWNEKSKKFYFIDSNELIEFDYDLDLGVASNPKITYKFNTTNSTIITAGLTIDSDGNLYVGTHNKTIYKIDPIESKVLQKISVDVRPIISLAFGGPDLDVLFLSTWKNTNAQDEQMSSIYTLTGLGVKGLRMTKVIV